MKIEVGPFSCENDIKNFFLRLNLDKIKIIYDSKITSFDINKTINHKESLIQDLKKIKINK